MTTTTPSSHTDAPKKKKGVALAGVGDKAPAPRQVIQPEDEGNVDQARGQIPGRQTRPQFFRPLIAGDRLHRLPAACERTRALHVLVFGPPLAVALAFFGTDVLYIQKHPWISNEDWATIRNRKNQTEFIEESFPFENAETHGQDFLLTEALRKAISKLSDEFRDALELRYYDDLSYEEIAETLGITVALAKVRVFRAKKQLTKTLSPILGELR